MLVAPRLPPVPRGGQSGLGRTAEEVTRRIYPGVNVDYSGELRPCLLIRDMICCSLGERSA